MTYPYSAISLNYDFATVVVLDLYDDLFGKYDDPRWPSNDPAYEVPFCLPDPSGLGGWVAVLGTQVHVPPIPGPWRNTGNGPLQVLWVNGAGEWGYSSYPDFGPGSLWDMRGSLRALRATIRPVRGFQEFDLPPQEFLQGLLESNAKSGWPLERLIALARGDISVDNPTLKLWLEDGNPSLRKEEEDDKPPHG